MTVYFIDSNSGETLSEVDFREIGFLPAVGTSVNFEYHTYEVVEREYHFDEGYLVVKVENLQ